MSTRSTDHIEQVMALWRLSRREARAVVAAARPVEHDAGAPVIREGERGIGVHLILAGQASVTRNGRVIATLGPGDVFGEIGLLERRARMADVVPGTTVRTLSIPAWTLVGLLERAPTFARELRTIAARRVDRPAAAAFR